MSSGRRPGGRDDNEGVNGIEPTGFKGIKRVRGNGKGEGGRVGKVVVGRAGEGRSARDSSDARGAIVETVQ